MAKSKRQGEIEALENAFWQSMIDREPGVATGMLTEPALMVSGHGANKFDHAGYTKMASDDRFTLKNFSIDAMDVVFPTDDVAVATYRVSQSLDMQGKPVAFDSFDSSTWVNLGGAWKCVAHTESPVTAKP